MAGVGMARSRALAVLRVRGTALAVALLPAAVAVVLLVGGATGRTGGPGGGGWTVVRWAVGALAVVALVLAGVVAAVLARARPAQSPTVEVDEAGAPELYRLVRDLAERLDVPAPSAIALTPDCDSWLEERPRPRVRRAARDTPGTGAGSLPPGHRPAGPGGRRPGAGVPPDGSPPGRTPALPWRRPEPPAPVLVIGSPFLWWMRVAELRALLAPVVAGTGPSADVEVAAARRFVRSLDATAAIGAPPGVFEGMAEDAPAPGRAPGPLRRPVLAFLGWSAKVLLRACRGHAAEMERAVAAWASERAQQVDYGLRIVAQEQVGLAYAGWDRLLTRVALPAWRMGRWPSRLDAGVVAALTELSRRDRLAEGFESRLGERPACDLLEEPGTVDEAASLLAARLFHAGPARPGPYWSPIGWEEYPEEVVDRLWRTEAARLHEVLDELDPVSSGDCRATVARVLDRLTRGDGEELAARLMTLVAREEAETAAAMLAEGVHCGAGMNGSPDGPEAGAGSRREPEPPLPVYQLQQPRTARDLLTEHVTAMVCCAAVDTGGAAPGLDWLDGPVLLVGGARRSDLAQPVVSLVERGDPWPLRSWLAGVNVPLEKPVRLV